LRLCRPRLDWLCLGWLRRNSFGSRCGAKSVFNRDSSHIHPDEKASGSEDYGRGSKPPQRSSPGRKFRRLKSDRAVEVSNKGAGQTQDGPAAKYHHRIRKCFGRQVLSEEGKKDYGRNAVEQNDDGDRAAGIPVPLAFHVKPISAVDGQFLPIVDFGIDGRTALSCEETFHRDSSDNRLYAKGDCRSSPLNG
jgi:hypothetical protein